MIRLLVTLTVLAYALVLFAAAVITIVFVGIVLGCWWVWEKWADRDKPRRLIEPIEPWSGVIDPVIPEWCETCGKQLRASDLVELSSTTAMPEMGGGVTMTATYCTTDAPEEATR